MAASMTSDEGDGCSFRRTGDCDGRRRRTPRCNRVQFGYVGEVLEGVESGSADNAESDGFYNPISVML